MNTQIEVQETEVQKRIRAFRQHYQNLGYGNGQYWFLCLAAFPIAVTPDMLYRLWTNFRQLFPNETSIDRVAVSDVLLWPAWHETAPGLFELDEDIRNALLTELKQLDEQRKQILPGSDLLRELAQFVYQYTTQTTTAANDSLLQKAQLLGVQALLAPGQAARQVEAELAEHIQKGNESEILRIRNLVGALAGLHPDFEPLLSVTKGLKAHLLGMPQAVWQRQFLRPNETAGGQVMGMVIDTNVAEGEPYLTVPLPSGMEGNLTLPERPEPELPTRLFLLCVGIDAYEGIPLQNCVNDAKLLVEVLPRYFMADNQEVIAKVLINEQATKEAILKSLDEQLRQARPDDIVVFAFSGHGQNAKQRAIQNTIAAYGFSSEIHAQSMKEPERMAAYMISETEFRNRVRTAGKNDPHVLLISDTHNGSPNWLDRGNPKHIILTAGSDWDNVVESQYEGESHGAFTAALVTALRSTHARSQQTYHRLIRHIYEQKAGFEQTPQLFGTESALRRPFLSTDDSGILYATELTLYGFRLQNSFTEQQLAAMEPVDLPALIKQALERYTGNTQMFSETSKNEVIARLEQANVTLDKEGELSAICIGGHTGLGRIYQFTGRLQDMRVDLNTFDIDHILFVYR